MKEKQVEKQVTNNESEEMWAEIKTLPISMFALPDQTIEQHVVRLPVPGKQLMLRLVSTAVLPALEETLANKTLTSGKKYEVEVAEGYTIIRRGSNREEEVKNILAPFLVV